MPKSLIWPFPRICIYVCFFPWIPLRPYKVHRENSLSRPLCLGLSWCVANTSWKFVEVVLGHFDLFFHKKVLDSVMVITYNLYPKVPMGTWGHVICHFHLRKISKMRLHSNDFPNHAMFAFSPTGPYVLVGYIRDAFIRMLSWVWLWLLPEMLLWWTRCSWGY